MNEATKLNARANLMLLVIVCLFAVSCQRTTQNLRHESATPAAVAQAKTLLKPLAPDSSPQLKQLIEGALEQAGVTVGYDPSYVAIDYPNGDVALETGVCSDVIVRAFRKAGIDLQQVVHEDMVRNWSAYPKKWGANRPDTNIDHRRVLNLTTYFARKNKTEPMTTRREDYLPGDIVAWDLGNGVDHIGIVTNMWSEESKGYLVVHNIGAGAKVEDVLFNWKMTGHYRYF